jgi:hypothetical protein
MLILSFSYGQDRFHDLYGSTNDMFDMSVTEQQQRTQEKPPVFKLINGIELAASSHYVSLPNFGEAIDSKGWRLNVGAKYYFDKELVGGVVLTELHYQRIGNFGFFQDHRVDDFNYLKTFGGTVGFGTSFDAADIFVAMSMSKVLDNNIEGVSSSIVELGIIGSVDLVTIFGFEVGVRADLMYQTSGTTAIRYNNPNNFPFRISGGVNITKSL